jgi:excisionase family DNA binding protein
MARASSTRRDNPEVLRRPGGGLGEPGPSGSPNSMAKARADVVSTLHQLIDTLNQLSDAASTTQSSSPPPDLPLLLDATEAANVLSLSRAKVCDMASRGELPSVRIGRSLRIPRDPLLAWIEKKSTSAKDPRPVPMPAWTQVDWSLER